MATSCAQFLAATVRTAAPRALGGTVVERAGVINIGLARRSIGVAR